MSSSSHSQRVLSPFASLAPVLVAIAVSVGCRQDVDEGLSLGSGSGGGNGQTSESDGTGTEGGSGGGSGSGETTADGGDGDGDGTTGGDLPQDVPGETTQGTQTGSGTGGDDCGNGMIDQGEQCDLANLNGFTCEQLGYGSGALACDPITCTYDTSGCIPDMTGTTG